MERVLLCRFGELFLKCGNRRLFERALAGNIRAALADVPSARVQPAHGRVLVRVPAADADDAAARLERVFGLVSFSIARQVPATADLEAISDAAIEEAQAAVARTHPRSASKSKRAAPTSAFPFPRWTSLAAWAAVSGKRPACPSTCTPLPCASAWRWPPTWPSSTPAPSRHRVACRWARRASALLLLSGGIDSPVAGWLAAKRGLALDAVYFHSPPYIGEKSRDKVLTLGRQLARWQALRSVTVVPFTDIQKRLRDAGADELAVVLYRRMMMRIADAVADRLGASGLVTGENLGQVASQTIENLTAIEAAARRVILRPLLTYDKVETTALARRIGTYDTSILPFEDCCSLFVPPHPATRARISDAERIEAQLDIPAEIAAALAGSERIEVR